MCHAVIFWLLLLGAVGTGETTVGRGGLESATLGAVVQSPPGGASGHGGHGGIDVVCKSGEAQVNRATFLFHSRSPPVRALKHHRTDQSERLVERYSYYTYLGTYLDVKRHWDFIIMLSL